MSWIKSTLYFLALHVVFYIFASASPGEHTQDAWRIDLLNPSSSMCRICLCEFDCNSERAYHATTVEICTLSMVIWGATAPSGNLGTRLMGTHTSFSRPRLFSFMPMATGNVTGREGMSVYEARNSAPKRGVSVSASTSKKTSKLTHDMLPDPEDTRMFTISSTSSVTKSSFFVVPPRNFLVGLPWAAWESLRTNVW